MYLYSVKIYYMVVNFTCKLLIKWLFNYYYLHLPPPPAPPFSCCVWLIDAVEACSVLHPVAGLCCCSSFLKAFYVRTWKVKEVCLYVNTAAWVTSHRFSLASCSTVKTGTVMIPHCLTTSAHFFLCFHCFDWEKIFEKCNSHLQLWQLLALKNIIQCNSLTCDKNRARSVSPAHIFCLFSWLRYNMPHFDGSTCPAARCTEESSACGKWLDRWPLPRERAK